MTPEYDNDADDHRRALAHAALGERKMLLMLAVRKQVVETAKNWVKAQRVSARKWGTSE